MNYRPARIEDCAAIATIYNQYLGVATLDLEITDANYFINMMRRFDEREGFFVVENDENTIIGWAKINHYSTKKGYQYMCNTAVFLDQNNTHQGIGTPFKKYIIQQCKMFGYRHLTTNVFANNTASITYNQKLGYRIAGSLPQVGHINGKWIDIVILHLDLDNV